LRFSCIHARRESWWDFLRLPVWGLMAINFVLMSTNAYHHLIWQSERWVDVGSAHLPWLEPGGAFYWIFQPAAIALPISGILALLVSAVDLPAVYTRQIAALAVGASIPVFVNLASKATAEPGIDLTPAAVGLAMISFGISTFRFQLLDVMPVAHSQLLEQLDDGVVVLDGEQRVVDVNPAAQRLLGCKEWIPGQSAESLLPFWGEQRRAIEMGTGGAIEVELSGQPGLVLEVRSSPVDNADGTLAGRVLLLHDASARARLVRELDSYAQSVAQDLRIPLVSLIDSLSEIHRHGSGGDAEATKHLLGAERVCHQMRGTIDALLLFASLRSDDAVALEAVDMRLLVDAALHRLSEAVKGSNAAVTIAGEWPAAMTQPHWVEEIWTNYLSNAVKYGGHPPIIEVGAAPAGAGGVRYWVRDNGGGLSAEQARQLFAEFTRLDPKRAEGHGLGLSIVRRIATKLGGEVGCDSSLGHGSTFWFTLPQQGREA
jgi:signal transduction histidine kinase